MENRVNGEILANKKVNTIEMTRDEALSSGALAFFGDKYGERVRVVEVPGFSKEFCGGTHVSQTGDIGFFLFTTTSGVSAGTRRVEAVAGGAALDGSSATWPSSTSCRTSRARNAGRWSTSTRSSRMSSRRATARSSGSR